MRLNNYVLIAGCLLLIQAGCQEQAGMKNAGVKSEDVKLDAKKPGPRITFESTVYDFGEVGLETENKGQYKFTNTGVDVLEIVKVAKCCGVVAELENGKKEYKPGESGVINLKWESGPLPSIMQKEIVVHSNDNSMPQLRLTLKAKVAEKVTCSPDRLRLFLGEENAACPAVEVKSIDGKPFSITKFVSTGDCITTDYDFSIEAPKHVLNLKVDMDKLADNMKGRISISVNHPNAKTATVLFDVLPKFTVSMPLIIIFNAEPGKTVTRTLSVQNNYHKKFDIESASSRDGTVKVMSQEEISDGYQLQVEITPPALAEGQIKYSDLFTITIKDGEELVIPCNLYYSKSKIKMSK